MRAHTMMKWAGVMVLASILSACQATDEAEDAVFKAVRDNDGARIGQYLAEGGDPDRVNGNGDSLLYVASGARGGLEVVELLILGGANMELANGDGRTPLHVAASWCNVDIVAALIFGGGADTSAPGRGGQSLLEAVCARPAARRNQVLALIDEAGR